jgi:hypothetical protein
LTPPGDAAKHLCAPIGNDNCPSWLLAQSGGHISLLLEDDGQGIGVEETSHRGMRDLTTVERIGHTSLEEQYVEYDYD